MPFFLAACFPLYSVFNSISLVCSSNSKGWFCWVLQMSLPGTLRNVHQWASWDSGRVLLYHPPLLTGRLYQGPSSLACLSKPSKYSRAHYSGRADCKSCWMKAKDSNYLLLHDTYRKCTEIQIQRTPSAWRDSATASLPSTSGSRSCLQCSNSFSGSKLSA